MQVNVAPNVLPGRGISLKPPTNKSTSLTLSLYATRILSRCASFMLVKLSMASARFRPQTFRNWLYGGKPWSRPRWMLIADRSPTIPRIVGPGVTRFSRTAGAKNLKCDQCSELVLWYNCCRCWHCRGCQGYRQRHRYCQRYFHYHYNRIWNGHCSLIKWPLGEIYKKDRGGLIGPLTHRRPLPPPRGWKKRLWFFLRCLVSRSKAGAFAVKNNMTADPYCFRIGNY